MRLNPKYFVPFLLSTAAFCVLAIVYFNVRFMDNQQIRFAETIGDGTEIMETGFSEFFGDESVFPEQFAGRPVIILFFASWSSRSLEARHEVIDVAAASEAEPVIILAAVKDDSAYLQEYKTDLSDGVRLVNATEFYNNARIPGLPALVAFYPDGELAGMHLGFKSSESYRFLKHILYPDTP